jgi:hypothetical protein
MKKQKSKCEGYRGGSELIKKSTLNRAFSGDHKPRECPILGFLKTWTSALPTQVHKGNGGSLNSLSPQIHAAAALRRR